MICTLYFENAGVCIAILPADFPIPSGLRSGRSALRRPAFGRLGDSRAAKLSRSYWPPWADGQPRANVCRGQMFAVDGIVAVSGLAGAGGFFAGVYAAENSSAVCRSAGRADGGYGSGRGGGIYCLRNTSLLSSRRGWRFGMPLRAGVLCAVESLAAARDGRKAVLIGAGAAAER